MRSLLGRFHRPNARSQSEQLFMLNNLGDGSTLSLDFTTGVLDPRLTFTRSTTGTYINSSGYVTSAAINASRFDYDPTALTPRGLLIEASASNLGSYSEDFSNAAWTKSGTNGSMVLTGTAPDNNATSRLLEENTTTYVKHSLERSISISAGIHTFSVWLKEPTSNSRRYAHIQLADGQATAARYTIVADLQTGAITASGANNGTAGAPTGTGHSITAYPNGWYRVTISMNHVSSPSYPTIMLGDTATLFGGNNQPFYSATTPYKGLLVWGAQFETGSGASSYIPTGASTGNRAADSCVMTGTNFSSWFAGATEGVLYSEFEKPRSQSGTIGHDHVAAGSRYSSGSAFVVYAAASVYYPTTLIWPTGGAIFPGGIASAIPSISKQAGKWFGGNDATNFANGVQGTTSAGTGTLTPTMLSIGANSATGTEATRDWLNACVRRVKFWPTALPDSQIVSITT